MSSGRGRRLRPPRGRSLHSQPGPRYPDKVVYVVAEGGVTEIDYCTALNNAFGQQCGFRINNPFVRASGLKPIDVAEYAIQAAGSGERGGTGTDTSSYPLQEVWALFDRDQHQGIREAFAEVKGHNAGARKRGMLKIEIAFSHPSFDLWLLLHFQPLTNPQGGSSDMVRKKLLILLEDPRLRVEFDRLLGEFFRYLDRVLPRAEALRYEDDARAFGAAQFRVRRCFRDTRSGSLDPYTYGAKVRDLIDRYLKAIGIAQHIPPVEITAAGFMERVEALSNPRVRALGMEHALRRHIAERRASDPHYYEQLSDRIDQLLKQLRADAQRLAVALGVLALEVRERETGVGDDGLAAHTEQPIRGVLEKLLHEGSAERRARAVASHSESDLLTRLTREIAFEIRQGTRPPHFMDAAVLQERLRKRIYNTLRDSDIYSEEAAARGAIELLDLARFNRDFYLDDDEPGGGDRDASGEGHADEAGEAPTMGLMKSAVSLVDNPADACYL